MEKFTRISSISEQHSADSHHMPRSYAPPSYGPMFMPIHPLLNHGDSEGISMRVWDYHCCGARKIRCPVIQEPFDFVLSILASAFVSAAVRHSFKKEPPTNLRLETQDIPYISYTHPMHVMYHRFTINIPRLIYFSVIKRGNGKSPISGGLSGKIAAELISPTNTEKYVGVTAICQP